MRELASAGKIKLLRYPKPFNYSIINNLAAAEAKGEVLVLLNNDTEVIAGDWLSELASHASRPGIGAVGALLLYPDNTIQHAGVVAGLGGLAGHAFVDFRWNDRQYFYLAVLTRNVTAVTGACLAVRKNLYHEIGGLDESLPVAFNDIDFCFRLAEKGYKNLYTPFARLYHYRV